MRRTADRKRGAARLYDQLYTVDERPPKLGTSSNLQLAAAAARYAAQFPSSHAARSTSTRRIESELEGLSRGSNDAFDAVEVSHLDWLGGGSDASSRLLRSALEIARPFFQRAPPQLAPPAAAAAAAAAFAEGPTPNPGLDAIMRAVSSLEEAMTRTGVDRAAGQPHVARRSLSPAPAPPADTAVASVLPVGAEGAIDDGRRAVPAGAIAQAALLIAPPRRHRRLEDAVAQSFERLDALEACLPVDTAAEALEAAASALQTQQGGASGGAGSSAAAVAARAQASALVDSDVAYLPALLAQAGVAMEAAMEAAVKHRGLVCSEEAELLAALWGSASAAVSPLLERHVSEYAVTRVDLELLRAAVAERRARALHEAEHLVVTTTALDVRCLRLRNSLARISAGSGQVSAEARSRCNTVIEWAMTLLGQARALLADAAQGDEEVSAVVGRAGSIRLDVTATWAPLRNMGREASVRAQVAARSNDAMIGTGAARLSLILEDEVALPEGSSAHAEGQQQQRHHHRHHSHHRRNHHHRSSIGGGLGDEEELDSIDAALGADIDSHVHVSTVAGGGDRTSDGDARRAQQRARGAVTRAVFAALAASETVDDGAQAVDSDSSAGGGEAATRAPSATALVRRYSARFAARSAQQLRASTALSQQSMMPSVRGSSSIPAAAAVSGGLHAPPGSARVHLKAAVLPTARSGWWGDEPLMSQRTTDLYQQVVRDSIGGGAPRQLAPSSPAAIAAAQKRKAEADAVAAAESALVAAQAAAAERSSHLQPTRSAMRYTPAGTARNDSSLAAALSTSHLKGGGVSFVPGAPVDMDDPRCTKHKPPSYSARFESPEVRDARELAESVTGMARARHARRKFRIAGIRARREVKAVALDALSDAVGSAGADALLALVVSLRAASSDLSLDTERLLSDLSRAHVASQAGASITHAVWEARAEARRVLIEKHLGLPSGFSRTRHSSISHAPLAFDVPSDTGAPKLSAIATVTFALHPSLSRRCSLPLRSELNCLSLTPNFSAFLSSHTSSKTKAPEPASTSVPSVDVPRLSDTAVAALLETDSPRPDEEHLHRSPNQRHAPGSPGARSVRSTAGDPPQPIVSDSASGGANLPASARNGKPPLRQPAKPITQIPQASDEMYAGVALPGDQAPSPAPRVLVTEEGDVAEWTTSEKPQAAVLGRAAATASGGVSSPATGRPPSEGGQPSKLFGIVTRVLSREGSRSDKKKQAEARVARSRASLASVLRSQLTATEPVQAPGVKAEGPPYPLKWALAQITSVINEWESQFRSLYVASLGEGGANALEWLADVRTSMAGGRPAPKGHGPSHSQGLELFFPAMFVPTVPDTPGQGLLSRAPSSSALQDSSLDTPDKAGGSGGDFAGSPRRSVRKLRKAGLGIGLAGAAEDSAAKVVPVRVPVISVSRASIIDEAAAAFASAPRGVSGLLRRQNSNLGAALGAVQAARQLKALEADRVAAMLRSAQGGGLANNGTPRATNPKIPFTSSRRGRLLCCDPNLGDDDSESAAQGMSIAVAHCLREPADPASLKISEGRLDWFVADHFQRSFGLEKLAMRHILTLLKCVRGYRSDKRIATFAALLSGALPQQDVLFTVAVRALCRAGVPLEAWTLVGQLPGGLTRYRAFQWWHFLWAAVVVRRWLIRTLQRRHGKGPCTMMDNFRARLAIKTCVVQKLITVGSGTAAEIRELFLPLARSRRIALSEAAHHDSNFAAIPDSGGIANPAESIENSSGEAGAPSVEIMSAICLSPRTELSMKHCAIAARDPEVLATFPFLAAAAPLLQASSTEAQLRAEGHVVVVSGSPTRASSRGLSRGDVGTSARDTERALSPNAASTRRSATAVAGTSVKLPSDDAVVRSSRWLEHSFSRSPKQGGRVSPGNVGSPSSPGRRSRLSASEDFTAVEAIPASLPPQHVPAAVSRLALPPAPVPPADGATAAGTLKNKLLWCTASDTPHTRRLDKSVTGFTFWSPHRLSKLLLMTPTPVSCKGLFLKSGNHPKSLTFPDSADNVPGSIQGLPPWVSSTRARDIAKLVLLPKDVPAALSAIDAASVRGLPAEWTQFAPKWPQRLVGQLSRTKRIGADTLAAILLASRQAAREEYRDALAADFVAYDSSGGGVLMKDDVIRAVADAFPGMFSRDFAEQLFALGAATPARSDRRLDDAADAGAEGGGVQVADPTASTSASSSAASLPVHRAVSITTNIGDTAGWTIQQWTMHMMSLSENVLL